MKVKIHYTYWLMAFSFVLCGYFINIIIFTLIIIIHELGHLVMAKFNRFKVNGITIYPYGGLINLEIKKNTLIGRELLVAIGGILFQIILFILMKLLFLSGIVRLYVYNIFLMYNTSILFFNILPITSLDGSKILCLILYYFIPFKYVLKIEFYNSILVTIFLCIIYKVNYSFILISFVIINKIILCYRNINYNFLSFLMERYLYDFYFKKVKVISKMDFMYREKRHIFVINGYQMTEKEYLRSKFGVKNKKMFD